MEPSAIEVVQDRRQQLPPVDQALGDPAELVVPFPLRSGGEVGPLTGLEEEDERSQRPVVLRDSLDLLGGGTFPLVVDEEVVGGVPLLQGGG